MHLSYTGAETKVSKLDLPDEGAREDSTVTAAEREASYRRLAEHLELTAQWISGYRRRRGASHPGPPLSAG